MRKSKGLFRAVLACSTIFAIQHVTSGFAQQSSPAIENQLKAVKKKIREGKKISSNLTRTAEKIRMELLKLQRKKVRIASAVRKSESDIFDLENELHTLNESQTKKLALLGGRWKQVSQINSALIKLSLLPPLSMVVYPTGVSNWIRTGILFGGTVPQIKKRAHRLREDLISLDQTKSQITRRKKDLAKATNILGKRQNKLEQILILKTGTRHKTLAARQVEATRLQRLTREARNLRELFDHLKKERLNRELPNKSASEKRASKSKRRNIPRRLDPNGTKDKTSPLQTGSITTARGELTFPVIGKINGQYGKRQQVGGARKGINIQSSPGAQVVAPFNGQIVFAGPFRGYGRLLIIEHGKGYHSLLAGMARINGSVGQWLLSGEPVAVMGEPLTGRPTLYMELRVNGQPVNPNPWLAVTKGKINR